MSKNKLIKKQKYNHLVNSVNGIIKYLPCEKIFYNKSLLRPNEPEFINSIENYKYTFSIQGEYIKNHKNIKQNTTKLDLTNERLYHSILYDDKFKSKINKTVISDLKKIIKQKKLMNSDKKKEKDNIFKKNISLYMDKFFNKKNGEYENGKNHESFLGKKTDEKGTETDWYPKFTNLKLMQTKFFMNASRNKNFIIRKKKFKNSLSLPIIKK